MATSIDPNRLERILRGQHEFLDQVHHLLEEEQKHDDIIKAVVLSSTKERVARIHGMDPARVFDLADIRSLCVRYRLRFLDSGTFKGDIPPQAVLAVRDLERRSDAPLTSFKIMAPAERFRLCDSEVDPLLFVPVGDDRFYLVHRWGGDVKWYRALYGAPFRTPLHLAATVVLVAALISLLIPGAQLAQWGVHRSLLLIWTTMVLSSFTVFGWFAFFGQFSNQAWNSRYFN